MNNLRRTIGVAVAALTLLPATAASASSDVAATVQTVAADAADLLVRERGLIAEAAPGADADPAERAATRAELRTVDAAGFEAMQELDRLGVELTEAMMATLALLPAAGRSNPGSIQTPPPVDVVYDAAIRDLDRIAETPSSFLPTDTGSSGPAIGLLAVALLSLLALGAAAVGNMFRTLPDSDDLEAMAWSDGLTGVANRRRLDHDLQGHEERGELTAIIMLDVDHFKDVNDSFGHRHGDEVLRRISTMISESVRHDDLVYRYGGEEFCVLLPGATTEEAHEIGQRIIAAAHSIELPDGGNVTVSLGIAQAPNGEVSTALAAADLALFSAKEQGRDRAIVAASADGSLASA